MKLKRNVEIQVKVANLAESLEITKLNVIAYPGAELKCANKVIKVLGTYIFEICLICFRS